MKGDDVEISEVHEKLEHEGEPPTPWALETIERLGRETNGSMALLVIDVREVLRGRRRAQARRVFVLAELGRACLAASQQARRETEGASCPT